MADDPKTGRDKPGFPTSLPGIFLGLAKGAISVFNPPPAVTRIDVWKQDGTWNNAGRLTRARDRIEAKPISGNAKQVRRETIAKAGLIDRINTRLDQLTEGSPIGPGDEPIPDFVDQEISPVFRPPGSIGIGGGVLLGVGGGGWDQVSKELKKAAIERAQKERGMPRQPVRRNLPRKLPATNTEKIFKGAIKVVEKIPKWALPNKELVDLAKVIGKNLKGAKAGIVGIIAQVSGELAIEKTAEVLARKQFEQMTKILGPQDAAAIAARQMAAKGPTTRRPGRQQLSQEPPRPRPPGNTGSPNQHPGQAKAPQAKPAAPGPLQKIEEVKVYAKKYATPAQIAQARAPRAPPGGITRSQVILGAAKALGQFGNAAIFGAKTRARSGSSTVNNFAPTSQPGRQLFAQPSAQAQTTAAKSCYTVCRKKSTGKKKRAKPRVCISPAKASRLGII
jgi:hypothetical protein